jgi:MAF protein
MGLVTDAVKPFRLVLASASPRRQALVRLLGLPWRAAPADVNELEFLLPDPFMAALNVARAKVLAISTAADDEIVVAADTLVVSDGLALGKPGGAQDAKRVLSALSGRAHEVVTGVVLRAADGRDWGGVVSTRVWMRRYTDAEVQAYVERGEPFDKAGGYAAQDAQFRPAERLEGCYLNVVGLPLCAVAAGLEALGVAIERPPHTRPACEYCRLGEPLVSIGAGCSRS